MLTLYRAGLEFAGAPALGDGDASVAARRRDAVLAFARGDRFACLVNFGPDPVELPPGADVLIASDELEGGALPLDTTVWLRPAGDQAPPGARWPRSDHTIG